MINVKEYAYLPLKKQLSYLKKLRKKTTDKKDIDFIDYEIHDIKNMIDLNNSPLQIK